jgi:hypothetical protein
MFLYLVEDLMTLKNHNELSERCELCFIKVIRGNLSLKVASKMFCASFYIVCQ